MAFDDLLEENRPLAPFTTLGIGGPARWFLEANTEEQVADAAAWARDQGVRLFVLGGGSNLVVSDDGFDGLIVHIALRGVEVGDAPHASGQRIYRAAAGEDWDRFVKRCCDENCAGIECLAGIPGTVGGTPVQNVGAYGQEVSSTIERVRAFDLATHTWEELGAWECRFSYRRSRFNTAHRRRFVVTRVDYRLTPGGAPTLTYADLQREFNSGAQPGLAEVAEAVRRIRQAKGMLLVEGDPDCRSAGSFFKNPIISEEHAARVAGISGKQPPQYPAPDPGRVKIPAAWLIEQAGFKKGDAFENAGISSRHTLALINRGGATAREILALADKIRNAVQERFGISLELEPVLLGFGSTPRL
ncbi:MAG TPA: UDP-N-acetylmuramate dehydrogenase [Terracidiphilus sp.]